MVIRRPNLTRKHNPIWENSVPVEKSQYIVEDDSPTIINARVEIPANSLIMVDLFCGCGGFSVGFR